MPFADSDTWGYLGPAVEHSQGHGFPQIYGRAFLYPSFLWAVLTCFHHFAAITVVQHVLGLGSGIVLWWAWENLRAILPRGWIYRAIHYTVGLFALTWLLVNNTTVYYEHRLRPEALFPLVTAATLWLAIRAFTLPAESRTFTRWGATLCAAHGVFYVLHPVFGFATLACSIPVTIRAICAKVAWWRRLAVPAALPITLLVLHVGERLVYTSRDAVAPIFGAMTCFAFQADVVVRELDRDLAAPENCAFAPELVRTASRLIHEELSRVASSGQSQGTLSYDADRLLYHPDSVCNAVRNYYQHNPAPIVQFFFHYFQRGVRADPGLYFAKVGRNLALVFGEESKLLSTVPERIAPTIDQANSRTSLVVPYPTILKTPAGAEYDRLLGILPAVDESSWNEPDLQRTIATASSAYPLVLAAVAFTAVGLAIAGSVGWKAARMLALRRLALISIQLFAYNIFLCLTVAMVSSLDNSRYAENQCTFTVFAFFTGLLLISATCVAMLPARIRPWLGAE